MPATLRSFLEQAGSRVIEIDEPIDPVTQVGILSSESRHPFLLNSLKGFPGWRLCDRLLASRELQALAIGAPDPRNINSYLAERMFRVGPGKSKLVPDGPCKEVKYIGEQADATKLPVPIH